MTRTAIEQLLARQKDAFARRDAEALASLHAPDGTFDSPAYGRVTGREGILAIYRYWYKAFPDLTVGAEGIMATRNVFDFSGTLLRAGVLKVKPS